MHAKRLNALYRIEDSIRIGGLKRALTALDPTQRRALKKAYKAAASLTPDLDKAWAAWPSVLIGYGLGIGGWSPARSWQPECGLA